MLVWLQFVFCTAVIVFSGERLSKYGDIIAEKTGMGQTWIGVALLASVTSLPELITGISSVAVYNLPNIAAGDVLGSCMFNIVILAALDVGRRRPPLSSLTHQGHVLTAAFGIVLLGITSIAILSPNSIPTVGWISVSSLILFGLYLVSMRLVFKYEKRRIREFLSAIVTETRYGQVSKSTAFGRFTIYSLIIVAAATYLPHVADEISTSTGLSRTFVGTIFVAVATSLPELIVSRAALGIGAIDLAVGNILGSNLFNIAILSLDDAVYLHGPILTRVSGNHVLTAVAAMAMTAVMIIALMYRSQQRILFISWESLGIFFIYAATSILLFLRR
jgi:cation:H+ antiporter